MRNLTLGLAAVALMGCATGRSPVVIDGRRPDVVIVGDDGDRNRGARGRGNRGGRGDRGYRTLRVPPGHYPPRGYCRVWYVSQPPGRQPSPVRCHQLNGRVPRRAFILYNGNAWDADYDWYSHERRYRGSVPRVIIQIVTSSRR